VIAPTRVIATIIAVVAVSALTHCGSTDANPGGPGGVPVGNVDAGTSGGSSGSSGSSGDGGPGGGPDADAIAQPKEPAFAFATTFPAVAGAVAALPDGGWAVVLNLFKPATIAGTLLPCVGRADMALVKVDAAGTVVWAKSISGDGDDEPTGVAVDEAGAIYLSGLSFGAGIDFGSGITLSGGPKGTTAQWGYWAKFDGSGAAQWARRVLADDGLTDLRIAVGNGTLAVLGRLTDPLLYSTGAGEILDTSPNATGLFVFSAPASTGLVAKATYYGATDAYPHGVAVDASGDIVITGLFTGPSLNDNTGAVVLSSGGAGSAVIVSALTSAGAQKWARAFPMTNPADLTAIYVVASGAGTVAVSGALKTPVDFGKGTRQVSGPSDPWIAVLDSATGTTVWDKVLSTTADEGTPGLASDSAGNLFAVVRLDVAPAPVAIDGISLPTSAGFYVAKLSPTGTLLWVRPTAVAPPATGGASSLAIGSSGRIAAIGSFQGAVDLGGATISRDAGASFSDTFLLGLTDAP
jgi:hypothetical protein